jgi:hypothetical protein
MMKDAMKYNRCRPYTAYALSSLYNANTNLQAGSERLSDLTLCFLSHQITPVHRKLHWLPILQRIKLKIALLIFTVQLHRHHQNFQSFLSRFISQIVYFCHLINTFQIFQTFDLPMVGVLSNLLLLLSGTHFLFHFVLHILLVPVTLPKTHLFLRNRASVLSVSLLIDPFLTLISFSLDFIIIT